MLANRRDRSLDAGRIEIVFLLVVIGWCGDYRKIGIRIRFLRVDGGMEIEWPFSGRVLLQKLGNHRIDNWTSAIVQ